MFHSQQEQTCSLKIEEEALNNNWAIETEACAFIDWPCCGQRKISKIKGPEQSVGAGLHTLVEKKL